MPCLGGNPPDVSSLLSYTFTSNLLAQLQQLIMAEPKISNENGVSSTEHSDVGVPVKDVDEKNVAVAPTRPEASRGFSEWEAIQIAAAGDNDTIDREIAEIEASLTAMNIKSTWYKPQLKLKNPKHFTFLLVGK